MTKVFFYRLIAILYIISALFIKVPSVFKDVFTITLSVILIVLTFNFKKDK